MRIAIMLFICTIFAACGKPASGPEEQIRQWVADAESHIENKERSDLMDMISSAYTDGRGNDKDSIDKRVRAIFFRMNNITMANTIDEIKANADSAAEVFMTVGMIGTESSALGLDADAYRFHLELEHDGDEWLLIGARYGKLGGDMR